MNAPLDALASGFVIGERYSLVEELGVGAMGVVWRATQLDLGRDVALKLLLPDAMLQKDARDRFEREARVASRLRHSNAVQIYDFGSHDGQLFIAMELLGGVTLRALVDADLPVVPLARIASVLGQVADAVATAHAISLVHRDLKPENIFLEDDRAVVVDFGLAFILGEGGPEGGRLTAEGIATGTPDYMPPERAAGELVGPPADVYAFGCVLYEMLTSKPPFTGTPMQLITQHLFSPPRSIHEARPDAWIPSAISDLCMRMLSKDPAQRPPMDRVREVLQTFDPGSTERERGRVRSGLQGRAARMISTTQASPHAAAMAASLRVSPRDQQPLHLAVVGELIGNLVLGLGANGVIAYIVSDEQPIEGADAIYAPGAESVELDELASHGIPIVTDVAAGDLSRVTQLLRAGVSEVVHRPVRSEDLAGKVLRAIRNHQERAENQS